MKLRQIATVFNQSIEGLSVLPQVLEVEVVKYVFGLGFHMLFKLHPFVKFVLFLTAQVPRVEQVYTVVASP